MKRFFILSILILVASGLGMSQTRDLLVGSGPGGGTPPQSVYENSWALLIAVDDYQYVPKLKYAVADAEAMRQYLVTTGGFSADRVYTLYTEEATRHAIETMLGTRLRAEVRENDRVLVFFAGHGQTDDLPKGGQMGYLVPVEGRHDNLYGTCLSMSQIRATSRMLASKHIFYVVDACYSGIAGVETRSIPDADASLYLSKLVSLPAVQIVTAGQARETVIEGEQFGGGHSIFSYHLINGLTQGTADLNGDGIIPASELYAYLAPRITRDSEGRQTPRLFNMDGDGEFVFFTAPVPKVKPSPPEPPKPQEPTRPPPPPAPLEMPADKIIFEFFKAVDGNDLYNVQKMASEYPALINVRAPKNRTMILDNLTTLKVYKDMTPLFYASSREMVDFLATYGADVDAKVGGYTPLHICAYACQIGCVEALLEHHADVNARNMEGKTPLSYTPQAETCAAVRELLVQQGGVE